MAGGEVDFLGTAQADIDDISTGVGNPAGQCSGKAWAFQAHVTTDHEGLTTQFHHQRTPDAVSDVVVELGGNLASDVVGLEALSLDGSEHWVINSRTAAILGWPAMENER
ncbi:hypothetical protein D3C81_1355110 [compost metagenome]